MLAKISTLNPEIQEQAKRLCRNYAKWLIENQEDPIRYRSAWTAMRFVSEIEIRSVNPYGEMRAAVMRRSGYYPSLDMWITRPGYYRVEPYDGKSNALYCECAEGFPWAWNNGNRQRWQDYNTKKEIAGDRVYREKMREAAMIESERQRNIDAHKIDRASKQFFGAFAMAGAVTVGTKEKERYE